MNIKPISFKSTFSINKRDLSGNKIKKIYDKENDFGMTFIHSTYDIQDKLFVDMPDIFDTKFQKLLRKLNVPFYQINRQESLSLENIRSRIILNTNITENEPQLIEIDSHKLDKELRKDENFYTGNKAGYGSEYKYERFKQYLKTNQKIKSPIIYLKKDDKKGITTHVYDGRHRLKVLIDMGLEKIPVTIDTQSLKLAKKIGLI